MATPNSATQPYFRPEEFEATFRNAYMEAVGSAPFDAKRASIAFANIIPQLNLSLEECRRLKWQYKGSTADDNPSKMEGLQATCRKNGVDITLVVGTVKGRDKGFPSEASVCIHGEIKSPSIIQSVQVVYRTDANGNPLTRTTTINYKDDLVGKRDRGKIEIVDRFGKPLITLKFDKFTLRIEPDELELLKVESMEVIVGKIIHNELDPIKFITDMY